MDYIKKRLLERSTWTGIIAILAALGVKLVPANQDAIITIGVTLAGLLFAATPDQQAKS